MKPFTPLAMNKCAYKPYDSSFVIAVSLYIIAGPLGNYMANAY